MKLKRTMTLLAGLLISKAAFAQSTPVVKQPREVTIEDIRASLNVLAKAGLLEQDNQTQDVKINSNIINMLRNEGFVATTNSVAGSICM